MHNLLIPAVALFLFSSAIALACFAFSHYRELCRRACENPQETRETILIATRNPKRYVLTHLHTYCTESAIVGSVALLAWLLIVFTSSTLIKNDKVAYDEKVSSTTSLASLRNPEGISGNFFLGSGTINSAPYYIAYQQAGQGYKLVTFPASALIVVEETRTDGVLEERIRTLPGIWGRIIPAASREYVTHIPQGSIMRKFALQ